MPQPTFTLAPQYVPADVEARLYRAWIDAGLFTADVDSPKPPYVIVIPPPNVTAVLHMGHGLNDTIQDVLVRFERMRGREALWLPGTDHAGIATQNVVERQLAAAGQTRADLGRDAFVERVWAFVRETGNAILEQLKVIGCSCDWSRTRFTLDAELSRAVREAFVRLWEEGLVYRGHRVIHWCPRCLTALSDEEAEFHDATGTLYHIRYRYTDSQEAGGGGSITVATTRPETLLGDVAVAVHPDDPRYHASIGRRLRLPVAGIDIPVIADSAVDPAFGTGAVKVTPAHDAADFEIGLRHGLAMPLVMTADGRMEAAGDDALRVPPPIRGLDRFVARKAVVERLTTEGLLEKTESHPHAIRRCYRCDTVVEPRLSDQWFVKMQPLAAPVLEAYARGEVRLVPDRWHATFVNWLESIRDWNISRQLWWGHRVPVFTCSACGRSWADREDPTRCPACGGDVTQDPDVLDTWFSSWLWPFSTMGWPDDTPDLRRFYPGHTLVTAPEILFFWVTRMLMAGLHFRGAVPFHIVYLHGTVRDTQHRKMSKSLGNGIDPLDVVRLYGADALRWTAVANTALGQDLILDPNDLETAFAPGRNFANKLWNIGRFVLAQLRADVPPIDQIDPGDLSLADRWILNQASEAVCAATDYMEQFRLDEAAKRCFEFVWRELADWYVEAVKPRLAAADPSARAAQAVLGHCFDSALRLLHPVVPFITEELWQKLPRRGPGEWLAVAAWPERRDPQYRDESLQFERVKQAVDQLRALRAEYRVAPKARPSAHIQARGADRPQTFAAERETIARLAQLGELVLDGAPQGPGAHAVFGDGSVVFLPLEGDILDQECRRLHTELERLDGHLAAQSRKLANEAFVARAPAEVVARERDKERTWHLQRSELVSKLESLGCS